MYKINTVSTKELRKRKELLQAEIVKAMGLHFTEANYYERGKTRLNAQVMANLIQVLEASNDFFNK